jgi:NADH-quinone oxidoreductase subunit M
MSGGQLYIPYLSFLLAIPALAAVVIMLLPRERVTWPRWVALAGAAAVLGVSIFVTATYRLADGGFQFRELQDLLPALGISYALGVDGMAVAMVLLTGIIIFTGVLASWDVTDRPQEFFALLLVLVAGVFAVFVSRDLFLFFLGYELAVLPMYLLIGIWGTGRREYSAMKLTLYLLVGSALMLVGILGVFFAAGGHSFHLGALQGVHYAKAFQVLFFPIMFLGFGTLAGFWPFHTWSPDGHASAPTAVSMLHAGVLMKLGAYGIIRLGLELLPAGAHAWAPYLALFTLVNIVYGALVAMAQTDLKYVVAYSSVSHMGIVLLGVCTLDAVALNGAVLQMFSHGVMTGLFFALVGMVYGRTHTRVIPDMGGLAARMPFLAFAFVVGGLVSLGLPGFSGFVAELLVFIGTFRTWPVVGAIAVTGILFTAIYVLRVVQKTFFGPEREAYAHVTDANPVEKACLGLLMLVLLGVGVYPGWLVAIINSSIVPLTALLGGAR